MKKIMEKIRDSKRKAELERKIFMEKL